MSKLLNNKFKRDFLTAFQDIIQRYVADPVSDEEKMHACILIELHDIIAKKLIEVKTEYKINLTAAQAFAIRILYTDLGIAIDNTSYVGNRLQILSNEIHQKYS